MFPEMNDFDKRHSKFGLRDPSLSGRCWKSATCKSCRPKSAGGGGQNEAERRIFNTFLLAVPLKCGNVQRMRRSRACSLKVCGPPVPGKAQKQPAAKARKVREENALSFVLCCVPLRQERLAASPLPDLAGRARAPMRRQGPFSRRHFQPFAAGRG
jgi:hypothetical protein